MANVNNLSLLHSLGDATDYRLRTSAIKN